MEPGHELTAQAFTGQKHNMDLGLYYYNARFYLPGIGRFASADTIVPDPMNPQQYNRYTYVLNNPLRYTDPTGHYCYDPSAGADLVGTCIDNDGTTTPLLMLPGATATPCNSCPGHNPQFGNMHAAYNVFIGLEQELGRSVTYQEVLAIVAFHEFGKQIRNDDEYNVALEAMGRQFYNFCGPSSVCQGDELWKFLGAQDSWTLANPVGFAEELRNGIIQPRDFAGAIRVLSQPFYDPANASTAQKRANWRSGANVSGVPFKYGNYSMFAREVRTQLAEVDGGINGLAVTTVYLNRPDLNYGNGYVVMTIGQHEYWTGQ